MYIRCASCYGSLWMSEAALESWDEAQVCPSCGEEYSLEMPSGRDDLAYAALNLGLTQQIDLPSAYSVLLEVMTLDQAADTASQMMTAAPPASAKRPAAAGALPPLPESTTKGPALDEVAYDPAFQPAVRRGDLTPRLARERGERSALMQRLTERHHLDSETAEKVADNRITLLAAVRGHRHREEETQIKHRLSWKPKHRGRPFATAALGVAILFLVGVHATQLWIDEIERAHQQELEVVARRAVEEVRTDGAASDSTPLPAAASGAPPAGTSLTVDRQGQPVGIEGPTPQAVLLAYCGAASDADFLEPVALTNTAASPRGQKIGIVKDWRDPGRPSAIQIRQDHRTRRWVAGNGVAPIRRLDPEQLRLAEAQTPVFAPSTPTPRPSPSG